jgi:hypothetical protein
MSLNPVLSDEEIDLLYRMYVGLHEKGNVELRTLLGKLIGNMPDFEQEALLPMSEMYISHPSVSNIEERDQVEIHPNYPNFTPGVYCIGVIASKPNVNVFTLTAMLRPVPLLKSIAGEEHGQVTSWEYFQYCTRYPGESRIEISLAGDSDSLAMFISTSICYPSDTKCAWVVVTATVEKGTTSI